MEEYHFDFTKYIERFEKETGLTYNKENTPAYLQYYTVITLDRMHAMFPDMDSIEKCIAGVNDRLEEVRDKIEILNQ